MSSGFAPLVGAWNRVSAEPGATGGAGVLGSLRAVPRSLVVRSLLVGLACLGGAGLVGCSAQGPSAELDVDRATKVVQSGLFLDESQTACVKGKLADDQVRAAVNTSTRATTEQQDAFRDAISSCVPPENLAEAYVNVIRSAAPGVSDGQLACSRGTITTLSGHDLSIAYVVAASPAAPSPVDTAALLERFTKDCGLGDLLTGGPTPPGTDGAPTTPPSTDAPSSEPSTTETVPDTSTP